MFKKIFAILTLVLALVSLLLLAFSFRDFSLTLLAQFVFTLLGLTVPVYLLTKKPTYLVGAYNPYIPIDAQDDEDLIHRFSIYSEIN